MSLRKSPTLTPAFLAANLANARKSTRPRTAQGKARVSLNGLRHGWRAPSFRSKLERFGSKEDVALFYSTYGVLSSWFGSASTIADRQAERFARRIWCALLGKDYRKALRNNREQALKPARPLERFPYRVHFRIDAPQLGRGITF